MEERGSSLEEVLRDERTGNSGVCPSCLHRLKSEVWFSILVPGRSNKRYVGCPWCVDLEIIAREAPDAVAGIHSLCQKYRRSEP